MSVSIGICAHRDEVGRCVHVCACVCVCVCACAQYGRVYRGLWHGTEVAIKTIILPAGMSGAQKREKMVSDTHTRARARARAHTHPGPYLLA